MKKILALLLALLLLVPCLASCKGEEPDELTLRVGTFNIKNGGKGVSYDMSVLANDIKACDLDVVGLQEVDVKTKRSGYIDALKLLAEAAGYQYYEFAKAIDYQSGEYGTAILSRYPIVSFEVTPLFVGAEMEGRSVGHAVIDVNGKNIDFFNTHLTVEDKNVRSSQFETLNEMVQGSATFIITADFNTEQESDFLKIKNSIRANNLQFKTFSGKSAIDDIILFNKWTVLDKGMKDIGTHSDHHLLWAEIKYDGTL